MRDIEILSHLSYDAWMMIIAWLMVIFVVWYFAIKMWNEHHEEWSGSGKLPDTDEFCDL